MSVKIQSPQTSGIATTPVDAVPLSERLQTRLPSPAPAPPRDDLARPAPETAEEPPALPEEHEQGQPPLPATHGDAAVAVPALAIPAPERTTGHAGVAEAAPRPDRDLPAGRAPRAAVVAPVVAAPKGDGTVGGAGKVAATLAPRASALAGTAVPPGGPATRVGASPVGVGEPGPVTMPGMAERSGTSPATADAGLRSPATAEVDAPVPRSPPTAAQSPAALAPASTPRQGQSQSRLRVHTVASSVDASAQRAPLPPSPPAAAVERAGPADASAETTSAHPAVAASASPMQQGAVPDGQTLADARRDEANLGTRQHVRAVRQAEALQTAMATRALGGSQVRVAFNSWGAGHAVTARLEGGRVHLQPSSARVGAALASSVAPGDAGLLIAVEGSDSATDERRRPRDQGPA